MQSIRLFALCIALTSCLVSASAQSYRTAVGLRVEQGFNVTLKQHIHQRWSAEGILHTGINSDNIGLTLLAERHQKILFRNLNLYWGAGGHFYQHNTALNEKTPEAPYFISGLSFIGGAELSLGRLNFSVDLKPEIHLTGETVHPLNWNGAAVSVRYIIAKRPRRGIRDMEVWGRLRMRERR
jgi:hypothetical protein